MVDNFKPVEAANEARSGAGAWSMPFATRSLPWLLGLVMLGFFGLTLNRWISPEGIGLVAGLEGLTWTPNLFLPVTSLLMEPIKLLPAAWVPLVANLFTAACAALSLVFLARSVALLPHDLSMDAPLPRRGFEPPKLMAGWRAGVPPVAAVLICGLQLSFWQSAISATGQMVNLLLFAYVIRCFLEFNASDKDSWLLKGAFVYGLAVANDGLLLLFAPVFLAGIFWVKRLFSINQRQLEQMLSRRDSLKLALWWQIPCLWLAGALLVFLPPVVAALSTHGHMDFWPALKLTAETFKAALTHLPREFLITTCLICVMPVFLIGLRYYHFLSGSNPLNLTMGVLFFQSIYGFFLLVNLWTFFDTPLSPRRQAPGLSTLPFYFLEALSIGFFIGHFLLTAQDQEKPAGGERRRSSSSERKRRQIYLLGRMLKGSLVAGAIILAFGVPAALVFKNWSEISLVRANPVAGYLQQVARALPAEGAVVVGQDTAQLIFLQAELVREGREAKYLMMNIRALEEDTNYVTFLKRQAHPGYNLDIPLPDVPAPEQRKLVPVTLLQNLSTNHNIYCLPPAPMENVMAEIFYFQPAGLIDQVDHYHQDDAFAPALSAAAIRDNQAFWQDFRNGLFTNLVHRINPPQRQPATGLVKRFVNTLRFWPEADRDSVIAGSYYAVALNDWGVELQKAGKLASAGQCFAEALQLNPRNAPAEINQGFNADYQANREITIQKPLDTVLSMNKYRDWHIVAAEGSVDEPNFCYMLGAIMADNHLYRPAIAQFERVKQLSPANVDTAVDLARLFVECHDITNTLLAANEVLALSPTNETGLFLKSNSEIRMQDYKDAIPLLSQLLAEDPTNNLALLNRAIAYRSSYLFDAARRDYREVIQSSPGAFPAYFDLAQMDDAANDLPSAITNYELFLEYAPPTVQEVSVAQGRLKELGVSFSTTNQPSVKPTK